MSQLTGPNSTPQKNWENLTDMTVGEILRRTRLHYGQSLTDVESILRIRAAQLQALEDGRIDLLPGRVYAIGFVRAYAEYLGLDGEKMVHLFKAQAGNPPRPRAELHFPVPASESKLPNNYILASSIAGVILVIAALVFMTGGLSREERGVPDVPQNLRADALAKQSPAKLAVAPPPVMGPVPPGAAIPQAVPGVQAIAAPLDPATAAASSATSAAVATATAAPQRQELMIRVLETAWVEVRGPDGRALLSRVLKPGDTYTVPPGPEMVLDTGNIGGLEFVLNGNVLPPLGAKGDVRRKISLDPAKLAPMQAGATPVSPRTDADTAATISPAAGGE